MEHMCEICEKTFKTKKELKRDFIIERDTSGKIFNCNICTKSFQSQNILRLHTKTVEENPTNVTHVVNHFLKQEL